MIALGLLSCPCPVEKVRELGFQSRPLGALTQLLFASKAMSPFFLSAQPLS
jgi:hypothetical protein